MTQMEVKIQMVPRWEKPLKIYEKNMKTGRKYGEKEKIQILIKSLIFRTLRIYIFSFYAFLFFVSLADAECLFAHAKVRKYFI